MVEKIDEDVTVTDTIDRMIEAIVHQMRLDGEDRLKVKIAYAMRSLKPTARRHIGSGCC
jgi:hypothetical protein